MWLISFHLLDYVRIIHDYPEVGLQQGDVGIIVEIFTGEEEEYEIQFTNANGQIFALINLSEKDIMKI